MKLSKQRQRDPGQKLGSADKKKEERIPDPEELISKRDYTGAITLLRAKRRSNPSDVRAAEWLAYTYFHNGQHKEAEQVYQELESRVGDDDKKKEEYRLYRAACSFHLGNYDEARKLAKACSRSHLQNRLLFHVAYRKADEEELLARHKELSEGVEDRLSEAAVHFLQRSFQDAAELYRELQKEASNSRERIALAVYVAICEYNRGYFDISLEELDSYLRVHPNSSSAVNAKACNIYKLQGGRAADKELKALEETVGKSAAQTDLIRHNHVVFRGGENSKQTLRRMLGFPEEARLNLAILHIREGEYDEALDLVSTLTPSNPIEHMVKATAHACAGHKRGDAEHLRMAQEHFYIVGSTQDDDNEPIHADSIEGRQCMASHAFLLREWEEVDRNLQSIQEYCGDDDDFKFNYGIAKAELGDFETAEEMLAQVKQVPNAWKYEHAAFLARCHIMNNSPDLAWKLYEDLDSSDHALSMLYVIANDCYRSGNFFHAARAFDLLERVDPSAEISEGKCGACVGHFQLVVANLEPAESIRDVVSMLRSSDIDVEPILRIIKNWCSANGIRLT